MTESFAELFEASQHALSKLKPGAIVSGVIVEIRSDVIVVNAGLKSEGVIDIEQFRTEAGDIDVKVGDTVKVALEYLENGFGDRPETVAETIQLAAATGLVGCSIEDSTQRSEQPLYEIAFAADRIRAAAEAARALPFPFTLTARAENYLVGQADIKDTIKRLQAYQEAGADVLYAPCLPTEQDIISVVSSVDRPVNVLMGGAQWNLASLSKIGVKRVSVGSALACAALGAFLRAAREMRTQGTFTFANENASFAELSSIFTG